MPDIPEIRPSRPEFSSGPCAKPPTWSIQSLKIDALGRSHRSKVGKARLKAAIDETRALLGVPDDYRIGIVPASDTGAFEMAMWTMLGERPVTVAAWESFGKGWVTDAVKQLKIDPVVLEADYGALPDLNAIDPAHDVVFTWNGTTSGVKVPDGDWISDHREGLTFCDATSAVFAMDLPWTKLDVTTYSWQKVLGGEAAHGVIILSPRAVARLENYTPAWPLPKIFRLTKGGKLIEGIFTGATINTPSMLCVEDCLFSLEWARSIGGLEGMIARSEANLVAIEQWISSSSWAAFLAEDAGIRSNTSVCLKVVDSEIAIWDADKQAAVPKRISALLDAEGVAFDIGGYRDAPPGLRIWCGATVDTADVEALLPWLDWAFETAKAELSE
ncbi:MAG: phosphoserine transaminase [Pseudomonadota bacterium]